MLCGLGSWREQQQAIESSQKTRMLYDKTTQNPAGFINLIHRLDATPDDLDYTHFFWLSSILIKNSIFSHCSCPVFDLVVGMSQAISKVNVKQCTDV